jgi:hypothetical protein
VLALAPNFRGLILSLHKSISVQLIRHQPLRPRFPGGDVGKTP